MASLFIADLHLSAERPETTRLFLDLLSTEAPRADGLYILGDLFEAWLGDDLILPEYQPVLEALKELRQRGVPIYVMHGNRDFLLGERFERLSGCQLLEDPFRLELYGTPTLLMHGDLLCTDDHDYMALRRQLRDPQWVAAFLNKPAAERLAFARQLRERSQRETGEKSETIMDVNPDTVRRYLQQHQATRLIHGHTHRPGEHTHSLERSTAQRYVLPDWGEHGGLLRCDANGCRAERFG
ncbi:MAG: UDP-2,3-diacylglucosamine diphosphatase [Pseudomonadota bacterium]